MALTLYDTLGIDPSAGEADIRRAYRKLAMQYHPDKNPDATESERFKHISHAYEILSDPEERERYDQFGDEGPGRDAGGGYPGDFEDIFSFFQSGAPPRGPAPPPPPPASLDFEVTLEDLYCGRRAKLTLSRTALCSGCAGTGGKTGAVARECKGCGGKGFDLKTRQMGPFTQQVKVPCARCHGAGRRFREKDACKRCKGACTREERLPVEVAIKPGMADGDVILLPKAGDQTVEQPLPSDVPLTLHLLPHPVYTRRGDDLYADVTISLAEALTGFSAPLLRSLDGRDLHITHPADGSIIRPGDIRCIRGEGMPTGGLLRRHGHLYLRFDVEFPPDGWAAKAELNMLREILPASPSRKRGKGARTEATLSKTEVPFYDEVEEEAEEEHYMPHPGHAQDPQCPQQ